MTLEASIDMMYSCNEDGYVRVQSLDFPDEDYFHIDGVPELLPGFWGNYLRGAVISLKRDFKMTKGINAVIRGKHPIGGLSSSAAVTTAYLLALCEVNDISISEIELIAYNHWVETNFIGLNNGILDQSANILGVDEHLMFMDCKTEEYELIKKPAHMKDFKIVVVFSGLTKNLMGTDYNNRVDECKVAAWILQELNNEKRKILQDTRLRNISPEVYEKYKDMIPGKFAKRAKHFYTENQRVIDGVKAWKKGDIKAFGKLMFESGESSNIGIFKYYDRRIELSVKSTLSCYIQGIIYLTLTDEYRCRFEHFIKYVNSFLIAMILCPVFMIIVYKHAQNCILVFGFKC